MKILYVEDDPKDADLTRRALAKSAPEVAVEIVVTYQKAVTRLEQASDYDLILTDLRLPDGDGLSLVAHIRGLGLPYAVVVISGKGDEESAVAALMAGADDYIVKHKEYLAQLPLTLENALQRHRAELNLHARPLRVLYGEHHTSDIDLTRRHLAQYAPFIRLEVVNTPLEITQRLSDLKIEEKFDVILLDYSLPGLNMLDLLKDTIQICGLGVPIVLITGQGSEEVAVQAIKLGAADYLVKNPGYLHKLPVVLENAFHMYQVRREQAALRDSEKKFRYLFFNNPQPMWVYDLQTLKFLEVNHAAIEKYGYSRPEFFGMSIADIRPQEDNARLAENVKKKRPSLQHSEDWRHVLKDGSVINVDIVSHELEFGGRKAALVIAQDITERKQAEEQIRYQANLLANVPDAIIAMDMQYNIQHWNAAAQTQYGWKAEEVLGHPMSNFIQNEYVDDSFEEILKKISEDGFWKGELTQNRKSGERFPVLTTLSFIKDLNEMPIGYIAINRDISDRKFVEESLAASEAELRALFASMQDIVMVIDKQGVYRKIAPTNLSLLSQPPEELLGKKLMDVFPSQQAEHFLKIVQQVLETGQTSNVEYELTIEGRQVWFSTTISRMTADNTLWVARDITRRKLAEEKFELQIQRLNALHKIDKAISGSVDIRVTFEILLEEVVSQMRVDAVAIWLLNSTNYILTCVSNRGFRNRGINQMQLRLGEASAGRIALDRSPIRISPISTNVHPFSNEGVRANEGFISYFGEPLIAKGKVVGVMELFNRSYIEPEKVWIDYLETLAGQAAIIINNAELFDGLYRANMELSIAYDETIVGWSKAMDLRDMETENHSQRVTELTLRLARALNIKESDLNQIKNGALLHDIGKIGVPDSILNKPGPLTDEEWLIMRKHPDFAFQMISPINYLKPALDIPYCHHEKWDGTGYPRGLKGDQIPLAARLFAVIDVWDALISDRAYRKAWDQHKALQYIQDQSGKHFDPRVVEAFLKMEK